MTGTKARRLLEIELMLVRSERTSAAAAKPEVLRGAEDAVTWLLAGVRSPAPLTGNSLDPSRDHDVRQEATQAEEVWFGATHVAVSPAASRGNVSQYANGVAKTLQWAWGWSEDDAMGRVDEDIEFEAEMVQ
jgi:hypothetical protein